MTNGNGPMAMSVEEAAARLRVGRTTLYKELRAGRLRAIKLGKRTLITVGDLEEWLAALPMRAAPCKPTRGEG